MQEPRLIAGRYRVVRPLGRGGSALVYEAVDEQTQTHVALKLLSTEEAVRQHARDLFEREFNALAQLTHPLIVRVLDYGVDQAPYYTMELLQGESLHGPLPWVEVCSLLRDVASALSLVHSRRLVHRDVTHRNVQRTPDGHAKLFDFGALAPMGPAADVVGTPPFIPPEAVAEQRLDARSDLFSLGALGYYLLTERHAYPARRLMDLGAAWKDPVEVPSRFAPDVPAVLDELIVALLSLNVVARPSSAAEVFNRLTAIASLPPAEAPEVAQAYLTSPALVGRVEATRQFRTILARTRQGRSTSLVLEGGRGLGRSRVLSSFLLEAKIEACVTLRADGGADSQHPLSLPRRLLRQLFTADPVVARDAAGMHGELLGPFLFGEEDAVFVARHRAKLVDAVCETLIAASRSRPIVVGVDDFERADVDSKQFVIRLARACHKTSLSLVVALVQDATTDAHTLLRELSSALALAPLSPTDMVQLVRSLFNDVPNVDTVSRWVHGLSAGRPRTALEALNHLVDTGVARYEEGSWVLPQRLEDLDLPPSIDQALDARIGLLGSDAKKVCRALALSSEEDPLRPNEYGHLEEGLTPARLDAALNELVARSVIVPRAESFGFTHDGVREAALRSIPVDELAALHLGLAKAYASSSAPSLVLAAFHYLEAGELEVAFSHGVCAVTRRSSIAVRGSAFLRTAAGVRAFEHFFEWGISQRKPWPAVLALGQMLLQHAAVADMRLLKYHRTVIARLRLDSGRDDWDELSDVEDPLERARMAIGRAYVRHEATPEPERSLPPLEAIAALCGAVAGLTGTYARRAEPLEVAKLQLLIEPFRSVSPAVAYIADLVSFSLDATLAREMGSTRDRIILALSSPVAGLEEVTRVGALWFNLYYRALDDACYGSPDAAAQVVPLLETATYAPLAWEARVVTQLFQGDIEGAEIAQRERDLAKLSRQAEMDGPLDTALVYEAGAFDYMGDVLRLKRYLPWLEARARECPGMNAQHQLHVGNYHRIRGELAKALTAYERAATFAPSASVHSEWGYISFRRAKVLVELGRAPEALALSEAAMLEARAHGANARILLRLEMALATAEAAVGATTEAAVRSEGVIQNAIDAKIGGILFVDLCRDHARVAQLSHNDGLLEHIITRLENLAATAKYPAFATKHAHLLRQAQGRGKFEVANNPLKALGAADSVQTSLLAGVRTQIQLCRGRGERARKVLTILLETAEADGGFLYLCEKDRVELAATSGDIVPPALLEASLTQRVRFGMSEDETTSDSATLSSLRPIDPQTFDVVEVMTQTGGRCVLTALAALKPRKALLEPVPMMVRAALSDALIAAGDTPGVPWT